MQLALLDRQIKSSEAERQSLIDARTGLFEVQQMRKGQQRIKKGKPKGQPTKAQAPLLKKSKALATPLLENQMRTVTLFKRRLSYIMDNSLKHGHSL